MTGSRQEPSLQGGLYRPNGDARRGGDSPVDVDDVDGREATSQGDSPPPVLGLGASII